MIFWYSVRMDKTIIYLVRHPETEWNRRNILQGRLNSPLTAKGRTVADKIGRRLANKGVTLIYSSDLGRCMKTSHIINRHLHAKILRSRRLREQDFGTLNGKGNECASAMLKKNNSILASCGVESLDHMRMRILLFLKNLRRYHGRKNILIITHTSISRTILSMLQKTPAQTRNLKLKDGEIRSLVIYPVFG